MINTLKKAGAEEVLVKGRNSYAVAPEQIDCDYYRFLQGDLSQLTPSKMII